MPSSRFNFGILLISSDLIASHLFSFHPSSFHLTSFDSISSHFISHLISSNRISSHVISCCVFSTSFTSSHLMSFQVVSPLLRPPPSSQLISIVFSCYHAISACLISSHVISVYLTLFNSSHLISFQLIFWSRCGIFFNSFLSLFQVVSFFIVFSLLYLHVYILWLPIRSLSPSHETP